MKVSVRNKIIALMKDGRERTQCDVFLAIGCSQKYASTVLSNLKSEKLISSVYLENHNAHIYQWVPTAPPATRPKVPRTEQEYAAAMLELAFEKEKRPKPRLPIDASDYYGVLKQEAEDRRNQMFQFIERNHPTTAEIAKQFAITPVIVQSDIKALRRRGVVSVGKKPVNYIVAQKRMAAE